VNRLTKEERTRIWHRLTYGEHMPTTGDVMDLQRALRECDSLDLELATMRDAVAVISEANREWIAGWGYIRAVLAGEVTWDDVEPQVRAFVDASRDRWRSKWALPEAEQ
jgi:hypothetical protein